MEKEKTITTLEDLEKLAEEKYLELLNNRQTTDILKAIGHFSDQTITNDVLILTQRPNATCVKRMKEWNYYKRSVIKNEKALKVITHHLDKSDKDFTDKDGNVYTNRVEKLQADIGYVFDISQTEGKEYPYYPLDISSASHPFYTGEQRKAANEGRVASFNKRFGAFANRGKKA